jgi:hypothetical protein
VNREDRLRKVIPGAADDLITALAAKPAAEVDLIVAALRQARRDALDHERERKRQRKLDDKKHGNYDEAQLAARNLRLVTSTGKRASADLDALASLAEFTRHSQVMIALAVDGLRANGASDADIASALGVTRQAVWSRFPRQVPLAAGAHIHAEEA